MKYIANCSGGKDSIATIILAHEHNEPLDEIIFAEVMFDESISGELPEHIDFFCNICVPLFESWGYKVNILHSGITYMDCFFRENTGRKVKERKGMYYGFPMAGKCLINRDCKVGAIKQYFKDKDMEQIIKYLGIAVDEPKRLKRLEGTNKVSLLAKYGYTEQMAFELCRKYELLSPIYDFAPRGGCWFCPNARRNELRNLYNNHRNLFDKLVELENVPNKVGYCFNTLTKKRIGYWKDEFELEDAQMTIFDFIK